MAHETIEMTEVIAIVDELSSPTNEQFMQALNGYSDTGVSLAATKLAMPDHLPQHLIRSVDYQLGSDSSNGLTPARAKKTIQAAYDDLVTVALANYAPITSLFGVGTINLGPGDHDVGTGLVIDYRYPVEIIGHRSGWGNWTTRNSSSRIMSSSASALQLILTGSDAAVTYGNRFVGISFVPNTAVNTALTACIRTQANTHFFVDYCAFDTADFTTVWNNYAIEMHPGVGAQDNAWHRITNCASGRMPFYKAPTGTNFNRSVIHNNAIAYAGTLPAIHLEGDWYSGSVSYNSIEGSCPAITCDGGLADHNVFISNSGEMNDAGLYPFYDINGAHQNSVFIGGHCPNPGQNGTWIDLASTTSGCVVISGGASIAGEAGYKRKYVDGTTAKLNTLISRNGLAPKVIAGAGKVTLADADFIASETGAWGFARNTTDSTIRLSVRDASGTWKNVQLT